MRLSEQYLLLKKAYPKVSLGEPITSSLGELAGIFFCTERNVKIIVKKLTELGWIEWSPGRGRGNVSSLTFLSETDEIILQEAKNYVEKGEMQQALNFIQEFSDTPVVSDQFMHWLTGYFGFQTVQKANESIEKIRVPVFKRIISLDPATIYYALDSHIVGQIFDTLVKYDGATNTVIPHLAHYWEVSEDGTAWTFHLRKGVMFHHGRELSARDVVYSFERVAFNPSAHQWMFTHMSKIEAIDQRTVCIQLTRPNHLFLRYLSTNSASVVPEDVCEEKKNAFEEQPIGTGPFRLAAKSADLCVLDAFPMHFAGRPHLDRVELLLMPESSSYLFDESCMDHLCFHGEFAKKHLPNWTKIQEMCTGSSLLTFNLNKQGPQQSVQFRKALHHLVNRKAMLQSLGGKRIYTSQGFQPNGVLTDEDEAYDPDFAAYLLKQSGYNGEPFHLYASEKYVPDALWIRDQCKALQINIVVHHLGSKEMMMSEVISQADGILYCIVFNDSQVCIVEMLQHANDSVRSHFNDYMLSYAQEIVDAALSEPDDVERQKWFAQLESKIKEEHAMLFLNHQRLDTSFHPSLRGVRFNSLGWIDFKHLWFHKQVN